MNFHPRGIAPGSTQTRFAATKPTSLDLDARTVQCVMSTGAAVARPFGVERLEISQRAVNLDRLTTVGIPILNSHQSIGISNSLGQLTRAWIKGGELLGEMQFNRTPEGDYALGMVERGELRGVSIGYRVDEWTITDENGNTIDPETQRVNYDAELTFTATKFSVFELSLCSVAADSSAMVRSIGGPAIGAHEAAAVRARMQARVRMSTRQRMFDRMADRD